MQLIGDVFAVSPSADLLCASLGAQKPSRRHSAAYRGEIRADDLSGYLFPLYTTIKVYTKVGSLH